MTWGNYLEGTWVNRGNEWEAMEMTGPRGRASHKMVTDLQGDRIFLFGGFAGFPLNDTWSFGANGWERLRPAQSPPPRYRHAMAWDGASKVVVMFGGSGFTSDTWEYGPDVKTWRKRTPTVSPPPRVDAAMAYHPLHNQIVLFGGQDSTGQQLDDTWIWNSSTGEWTEWIDQRKGNLPQPPPKAGHTLAHDPVKDVLVMLGGGIGESRPGIWEWDGNGWNQPNPDPPQMAHNPMAYDERRQEIVMFAGWQVEPATPQTWVLRGRKWTERTPLVSPSLRRRPAMVYHAGLQRTLLYSGYAEMGIQQDTWEWDGFNWSRLPTNAPTYLVGEHGLRPGARERGDVWRHRPVRLAQRDLGVRQKQLEPDHRGEPAAGP